MINKLYDFLKEVDADFPIKLSAKTDLMLISKKLYEKGNCFFKEDGNKIVALTAGYINDYETMTAYISVVATLRQYRKRGLAKKLVKQFLDASKQKGMKNVILYTHKTNLSALNMYKSMGFFEVQSDRTDSVKLLKLL